MNTDTNELLQFAQSLLTPLVERFEQPEPNRLDAYLPAEKIVDGVRSMIENKRWHLSAITGMDIPQTADGDGQIEILYHFCQHAAVVTLRIVVPYSDPESPSICGLIPSATLYEREVMEMLGVRFEGTPSHDRLLLPEDWPDWVYPMRKSFKGLEQNEQAAIGKSHSQQPE